MFPERCSITVICSILKEIELHHFSYAGYYEMISQYDGSEWSTYYVSRMDPSDAEKDGKSHSSFLVVGENRVTDNVAEYCSSEEDNESYTILSVDPGVSGEFKVPRKVSGTPLITGMRFH